MNTQEQSNNKEGNPINEVIYASEHFDVTIGMLPNDELNQYIITNRQYGVVEYACNTEYMFREWLVEMEKRMREQATAKPKADVVSLHS